MQHLGKFTLCFWILFCSLQFFQNQLFWKILSGIPSEYQIVWIQIRPDRHFVGPDLGPNCLQRSLADITSGQRVSLWEDNCGDGKLRGKYFCFIWCDWLKLFTLCMQGNFPGYFVVCWFFLKINSYSNISFRNIYTVKSRLGPKFCRAWSGSKLFAKVIRRWYWQVNC